MNSTADKFYVRRSNSDGRQGYVGPLPQARALREVAAWNACEGWSAEALAATPAVRDTVRAWEDSRPMYSPAGLPVTRKTRRVQASRRAGSRQ